MSKNKTRKKNLKGTGPGSGDPPPKDIPSNGSFEKFPPFSGSGKNILTGPRSRVP